MKQEMMGRSGIGWSICKSYAPLPRQITMPTPYCSIFSGRMLFLAPNNTVKALNASNAALKRFRLYITFIIIYHIHKNTLKNTTHFGTF